MIFQKPEVTDTGTMLGCRLLVRTVGGIQQPSDVGVRGGRSGGK